MLITILMGLRISSAQEAERYHVVLDITRGVQTGCVYKNNQEIRCFSLSAGRNLKETYNASNGNKVRYCSFTTTGEDLKPQLIQKVRQSKEFRKGLKYFVSFDEARGIGTHTGDISQYSGGCIRLSEANAKFLYELVRDNSEINGQRVVSSNVSYTVIDNTSDRAANECDCVSNYLRHLTIHKERETQICNNEPFKVELPEYLKPKPIRPKTRPDGLIKEN